MSDDPLDDVGRRLSRLVSALPGPVRRIRLQQGDVVVDVEWPGEVTTVASAAAAPPPVAAADPAETEAHYVCAALVATFYRAPKPGADPFVRTGDTVVAGQQIAILEAMKMMMPVTADVAGEVTRVLVEDGAPVEYGQRLFAIAPPTAD
ncbi:acetyl-CoA carboxylase biotin carboxyl carrier protein [Jidongwangia harbinensis]|uniref:acetyl-CoA carboxylase biotin carboxyl carrier protein n=1 Tax=Jidongwangia harbinensis TaxID=2878561 RepID=UPI001CD91BF8|nr:biotin/lipoyl-containing protein [Jidongwangia harbinensis]MCA2219214.1 biotin/lipoyl-binding protein [Jidongwangia harbinensis]